MQENDLLDWLTQTTGLKRWFVLGGGSILIALFFGILGAILAYRYVGFSSQFTSLLISGFGALSTVLLVFVTFATFLQNQMQMEKENQRVLVRAEFREVVQQSAARLEANRSTVKDSAVRWHRFDSDQWRNAELPGFELERLCGRSDDDDMVFERFFDREPVIAEKFEEHDERVTTLAIRGAELVESLTEPIGRYLEQTDLHHEYDDPPEPKNIALYIANDMSELRDLNSDQEFWRDYQDDFRMLANDVAPDEMEAFRRAKRNYLEFVGSLKGELRGTRRQLEQTYSISVNENRTDEKPETIAGVNSGYSAR